MQTSRINVKNALLRARQSTNPGHLNNGSEVRVVLNFTMRPPTEDARKESTLARKAGLDLKTFTGHLDRVFYSSADKLCFTVLAKERVNLQSKSYCYRTFNVDSGQVQSLQVLA